MTAGPVFSVLEPHGPQAREIHHLWTLFLAISVAVTFLILLFEIAGVAAAVRRARRRGVDDPLAVDKGLERRSLRTIIAAGTVTALTLLGLIAASTVTGDALADLDAGDQPLEVTITGHQWWWEIEYEHQDPSRRVTTANELHIPVGRSVRLQLLSTDVIHSFWVPSLHGKKDLVPGHRNWTWIRADHPGVFRGQCAEFCGLQHARMLVRVIAEPPAAFEGWLAAQRRPAPPTAEARVQRGEQIFQAGPCAMCHTVSGTAAGGALGPDLTHLMSRATLASGVLANTRANRAAWVSDPQRLKPGVRMPSRLVAGDDLDAVLDYLETLQ